MRQDVHLYICQRDSLVTRILIYDARKQLVIFQFCKQKSCKTDHCVLIQIELIDWN